MAHLFLDKTLQKREHLLVGLPSFHTCSSASATVLLDLGKGRGEEMHLLEGKEKTRRATRAQRPTKASPYPDGSGASCRPPLPVLSAVRSQLPVEEPQCPVSMGGLGPVLQVSSQGFSRRDCHLHFTQQALRSTRIGKPVQGSQLSGWAGN